MASSGTLVLNCGMGCTIQNSGSQLNYKIYVVGHKFLLVSLYTCIFVHLKEVKVVCFVLNFFICSARWIGNHGFSIGINDVQPGDTLNKEKKATLDKEYGNCTDYIKSYASGTLEPQAGCNKAETLEAMITKTLNDIRDATASVRFYVFFDICDYWCFVDC